MSQSKTLSLLLLVSCVAYFAANPLILRADDTDPPHQTHLTAEKGPKGILLVEGLNAGDECRRCHDGPPSWSNVDTDRCATCHTTGGVYNGVADADVGALNNWENRESDLGATQSLVYAQDGSLKPGKNKWCAACHDQSETGTPARGTPIDGFESAISNWTAGGDISAYSVEPYWQEGRMHNGIKGAYMAFQLQWSKTPQGYGQITKDLSGNEQDFSNRDSFNFYFLMEDAREIMGIKAGVKINGQWSICTCYVNYAGDPGPYIKINGFEDNTWTLVSLPRVAFNGPAWDSGLVDRINIQFYEEAAGGNYTKYFCVDEIGCDITGHDVVGNNQTEGAYKTGHSFCTKCHDPGSGHIDGNRLMVWESIYNDLDSDQHSNPTNFRFYDDPNKQITMFLPYTYMPVSDDYRLCTQCHLEEWVLGEDAANTNFVGDSGANNGENLHSYHMPSPTPGVAPLTCVSCHDPHGQEHPAMTRKLAGYLLYFDENGCRIEYGEDRDNDGTMDWYDPDVNVGLAQEHNGLEGSDDTDSMEPMCAATCHAAGISPNEDPCDPAYNPYVDDGSYEDWSYYYRSYAYVPHTGGGEVDESCAVTGCHDGTEGSHATHTQGTAKGPDPLACEDCHIDGTVEVADMVDAAACDSCHSPLGAFDGVEDAEVGAATNWDNIYEIDGKALKPGRDNWCLSCHDDNPHTTDTNESSLIGGVYAPNIAGDENNGNNYGYNITGHKVDCLECHVTDKDHIDGEHRTYEVANDGEAGQVVVNPYLDSYRLKDGSMRVPAPAGAAVIDVTDYGLCFECHNVDEVLGFELDQDDVSHTNFWDSAPQATAIGNAHNYHLRVGSARGDTDWDGIVDARETCISCHTVHGSPTGMIRNGQLISTPGTTDRMPALNFSYTTIESIGSPATATFTSSALSTTASYNVYAWWTSASNRAEDATYTVSHDGGGSPDAVTVDQTVNGGQWNLLGMYSYNAGSTGTVVLDNNFAIGQIVIADAIKWEEVGNPGNSVIVDNVNAVFVDDQNTWQTSTNQTPNPYGPDVRFISSHLQAVPDPALTLATSEGGWTQYGSGAIAANDICKACHGDGFAQYRRVPNLWPKVLTTPGVVPDVVPNNETGLSLISVTINDPDNNVSSVVIDLSSIGGSSSQPMYDDGSNGDKVAGDKVYSYQLTIASGTTDAFYRFEITATDSDANTGTGVVELLVEDPTAVYVDNRDADFFPDCTYPCDPNVAWAFSSAVEEDFETGVRWKFGGTGTATATWTPTVPEAGTYEVYAWWTSASNRATDVPYTINYDGGSVTIDVNQQINGGQWNLLDTVSFLAGTSGTVVLTDNANGLVIADAIKLVPVP